MTIPQGPVQRLASKASELTRVSLQDITGSRKFKLIARARFAVYWAARAQGYSYPRIARVLGRRDHSTVKRGYQRAEAMRESDPAFKALCKALCDELEAV